MNMAIKTNIGTPQLDMILGKRDIKPRVSMGTQQSENANTIAHAILNTFLFLFARFFSALFDCSPGRVCSLSLMTMMEYRMTSRTIVMMIIM